MAQALTETIPMIAAMIATLTLIAYAAKVAAMWKAGDL
jgi:hypothetical protein